MIASSRAFAPFAQVVKLADERGDNPRGGTCRES